MPATAGGVAGGKVAIDNERQISMRIRPHFLGSRARSTTKSPATQVKFYAIWHHYFLPWDFRYFFYALIVKICRSTGFWKISEKIYSNIVVNKLNKQQAIFQNTVVEKAVRVRQRSARPLLKISRILLVY